MFKRVIIVLVMLFSAVAALSLRAAYAQVPGGPAGGGFYSRVLDLLHAEQKDMSAVKTPAGDIAFVLVCDIAFSLLCLWAAIWTITGVKAFDPKKYGWFIVGLNLAWFGSLVGFDLLWGMLNFLVVKLRPDYRGNILDFLSVMMLATTVLIYIWVLARTFSLGFVGALSVFALSHAIYFAAIFIFSVVAPVDNHYCALVRSGMGLGPVIKGYLADMNHVAGDNGILALLRLRLFHI